MKAALRPIVLGLFILGAILVLVACGPPDVESVIPYDMFATQTAAAPTPVVLPTYTPDPNAVAEVAEASSDSCVACHSSQEALVANTQEQVTEVVASSGEG